MVSPFSRFATTSSVIYHFIIALELANRCSAVNYSSFIGYPTFQDHLELPREDDYSLHMSMPGLDEGLMFCDKRFKFLQIDTNGHIDFINNSTAQCPVVFPQGFRNNGRATLSPFGADLDNSQSTTMSHIYYAVYWSSNISLIADNITYALVGHPPFTAAAFVPKWALLVTYYQMPFFLHEDHQVSFQAILVTDGDTTFAVFNYDHNGMDVFGTAIMGYASADGKFFVNMPQSVVSNLNTTVGNTGILGQWVFRLDQAVHNMPFGESSQLECPYRPAPGHSVAITWFREEERLTESDVQGSTSHRLIIRRVNVLDSGSYQCRVDSKTTFATAIVVPNTASNCTCANEAVNPVKPSEIETTCTSPAVQPTSIGLAIHSTAQPASNHSTIPSTGPGEVCHSSTEEMMAVSSVLGIIVFILMSVNAVLIAIIVAQRHGCCVKSKKSSSWTYVVTRNSYHHSNEPLQPVAIAHRRFAPDGIRTGSTQIHSNSALNRQSLTELASVVNNPLYDGTPLPRPPRTVAYLNTDALYDMPDAPAGTGYTDSAPIYSTVH